MKFDSRPNIKYLVKRFTREEKRQPNQYARRPLLNDKEKAMVSKRVNKKLMEIWFKNLDDPFENEKEAMTMLLDMALFHLNRNEADEAMKLLKQMRDGGYAIKEVSSKIVCFKE